MRKENRHGLPQNIVEAGDHEHLLGADHVVLQHERQDREEQADPSREHYEGGQDSADVGRRSDLLDFVPAKRLQGEKLFGE